MYRCPIPANLLQENRIDVIDLKTEEDSEREVLQLYQALGQCSVDKKEIKTVVDRINEESNK